MHNIVYKIQKIRNFSIIGQQSPTIQESQKMEIESLIGQGFA